LKRRRSDGSGYSDEESAAILAFLEQVLVTSNDQQDVLTAALLELEDEPMAQVMSRWERSGLRKGRREGREEGREEGRKELLLRLLEHKFGVADEGTIARIEALKAAQLLELYDAALDFTDRAEMDRWFEANQPR
jgi:predicted transposase YdaD